MRHSAEARWLPSPRGCGAHMKTTVRRPSETVVEEEERSKVMAEVARDMQGIHEIMNDLAGAVDVRFSAFGFAVRPQCPGTRADT